MEHKCIKEEIIETLRSEIQILKIELEVQKSSITGIKEDIKGLKIDIKDMSNKMNEGFKAIDRKTIAILTGIVLSIVANFFIK